MVEFRRSGDSAASRERLEEAIEVNSFISDLLLELEDLPDDSPGGYTIGSFEEAVIYYVDAEVAWRETPGALDWLEERISDDGEDS